MMWIYPNDMTPSDYRPEIGDVVIVTETEFGAEDRYVALVMEWDGNVVNLMMMPDTDPRSFGYDGG